MNEIEQYEFDRVGYIVIENMLTGEQVACLAAAVDRLEEHAAAHVNEPPRKVSPWGAEYHASDELGYHVQGARAEGKTLIIEDFWNADAAFDVLVNHQRTMDYIGTLIVPRPTVNNSEIRIRYKDNASGHHGGMRPENQKYAYTFNNGRIDCMMVRMIYFIHDNDAAGGAFTVLPGTHKSNLATPYDPNPDTEPGTVALSVQAGDAILFTEALRHGGRTNVSDRVRKTIHVGYGPFWLQSQNIATMDDPPYITDATRLRWTDEQQALFRSRPGASSQ